jgi:hypothetical protein
MEIINLYKRYYKAEMSKNINNQIKMTESGKITPSKCPAIRHAYNLGCYISSPSNYFFQNSNFIVNRYKLYDELFLDPGVIGTPDSNNFYARIDTGFSFNDLIIDVLATPILTPNMNNEFQIPPVVYPRGYTGPILAPIYSKNTLEIKASQPIVQLIPLGLNYEFKVLSYEIKHKEFEGLFYDSELENLIYVDKVYNMEIF